MASIPPFPGRDRNEAVLKPDVIYTEGGIPQNPSDLPPRWRNYSRAVNAMQAGVRLGQSNEEIMDAMFRAAEGDAASIQSATGFGREIAYYDSADRPGRYGIRPSREQAALLDREAQGARYLGDALMAAPYEAAKWMEMNTPLKPLSLVAQTVGGRNRKLDAQLEALGLPTSQVLALHYISKGSDDPWPWMIDESTSKPSVENVIAALAGGKRQLEDEYAKRRW